ncbi:MAG: phosphatase PAP2 family protein, partial [Chitinophagaceae bacterium]
MQKLIHRLRTSYNPWFIYPFLIWMAVGILLLMAVSRDLLFSTVNLHHNAFFDVFMPVASAFGEGWGVVPILVGMLVFRACRNWWYLLAASVCIGIPALLGQAVKGVVNAPRPFEYYKADPSWIHFNTLWGEHLYHNSFPSGHSIGIFSLCVFISMILPKKWEKFGLVLFF